MITMVWISLLLLLSLIVQQISTKSERQKRYLIFTKDTQFGVFATVSVPLHPETLVSVAWFFEAQYYVVDNSTWFEPLLGDVTVGEVSRSKERMLEEERSVKELREVVNRKRLYVFLEAMLDKHGHPGKPCLLRAICENAIDHFLHNGLLGDVIHLILTPSASLSEVDLEDCYYEAEYLGMENKCEYYNDDCPMSPLDFLSVNAEMYL